MKNYKVFENRPELSKEQLKEGMDFNKIKMNAGLSKTALLKSLIIKGVLGIAIVSSGVFIYKMVSNSSPESKSTATIDSAKNTRELIINPTKNDEKINNDTLNTFRLDEKKNLVKSNSNLNQSIDSTKSIVATNKIDNSVIANEKTSNIEDKPMIDSLTKNQETVTKTTTSYKSSTVTKVKSCKIWDSKNFCDLPKTAKFPISFDCDGCEFEYIDCQTANQTNNIICVWLTVSTNGKSTLQIESQLKNIALVKENSNKLQSPLMIGISADNKFLGANFKAKKYKGIFNKQIDIFMFFKGAKVGDKIIINDFIEALIEH